MRILLADDEDLYHSLVDEIFKKEGYSFLHAKDGQQALKLFEQERPDIVLTDYHMPGLTGIELCRSIKALEPNRFVPMVMFTGLGRQQVLKESLEAGVIEFLNKPVSLDELRLRIHALVQLTSLHKNLELAKSESDEEMLITKHILQRLVEPGLRALPPLFHMETLQTQRINGDACTYREGMPGVHFGFICDATGHGLTAGVSTIPAIQAFLSMAGRDLPLEIIYREINTRLRSMLPVGRFVCLMLIRLDLHNASLTVLNAGLPDAILRQGEHHYRTFPSRNVPASVIQELDHPVVEEVAIATGDRLLAFTDGLEEVMAEKGIDPLMASDLMLMPHDVHVAVIQETLGFGIQNKERHDDVSWALWEVPTYRPPKANLPQEASQSKTPLQDGFSLLIELDPRDHSLREVIPDCIRLLGNHGMAPASVQQLSLALTEALTNAVDHGVLGLDSALKEQGFDVYDATRRERLAAITNGRVSLRTALKVDEASRVRAIQVEVKDSGQGFDWKAWLAANSGEGTRVSGRGLLILKSLCGDLTFNEAGNGLSFTLPCG